MSDDDAAAWRDLTDQLTREQIAKLDERERNGTQPKVLLYNARRRAEQNMIEMVYRPDPLPSDATGCTGWYAREEGGHWARRFCGSVRVIDKATTLPVEIWDGESTRIVDATSASG
jgi:hypothetical protein